ncbi:tyrosine-type recombinase/integrase [Modestobacter caceresii]|uniref:tyrosine-type recombinase/integrase n=1 Tax=Modestobacter caceresii TaxID=1522368 RepID=UPI0009E083DE
MGGGTGARLHHRDRHSPGAAKRPAPVRATRPKGGLAGVSLHTLRHTAASLLLAAGTHTKVMQEHLGHSSYAITADHLQPRHAGTAARGLAVDPHRP